MERLTEWAAPGIAVPAYPTEAYLERKVLNDFDQAVITRLAAYEDTGLEPEEINEIFEAGRQDVLRETGWVSVKDRLPGEAGTYLVATRNRAVKITHFYLLQQIFSSKRINRLVTHWMPLPEPPKEVE